MTSSAAPAAESVDPWQRYGWIMGAIWLVFLAFPILESTQVDRATGWQVASVLSIVGFAAAYVVGFIRLDRFDTPGQVHRFALRWLVVLAAFCVLPAMVIGVEALGMTPFLVAFCMFGTPLRFAITFGVVAILSCILLPLAAGRLDELWFFILIVTLVAVTTGVVRVLEDRGVEHRELEHQMTIVSERERVARDVHDVLGHSLTVITMKSELARSMVDRDLDRARTEIDDVIALSRTALAEVRATVAGLRVARLDDEVAAAQVALTGAGIAAELPADTSVVDPRHRMVLAWVLREGVTNVVRHSGATRCLVTLTSHGIVIDDDGTGLDGRPEGNGLRGLRERVCGVGGELELGHDHDRRGTRLEVRL